MATAADSDLIRSLDACLPQTQCTRCGYPRCWEYAAALARGETGLNRCPPGGKATIAALAQLLSRPMAALDPACGTHEPRTRALIEEGLCIGCRKCIDVCPVDAIVGARKSMHTVLEAECNGCALCLPTCPVDCIALLPAVIAPDPDSPWPEYTRAEAARWRARTEARRARLARRKQKRARPAKIASESERQRIRDEIRAAVERVRSRKRQA